MKYRKQFLKTAPIVLEAKYHFDVLKQITIAVSRLEDFSTKNEELSTVECMLFFKQL